MPQTSKRMRFLHNQAAMSDSLDTAGAVALLKSLELALPKTIRSCRFNQTVTIAVRLGIDPRQADQIVRGSIVLPHGTGKSKRVLVFAQGDNLGIAAAAGADHIGGKELADRIRSGWTDFDVAIATPDMMGVVGPLGKILGPRGLMPSPRAGTVTQDIASVIGEYKAGKVEFRCDAGGNVHCVVGKLSFEHEKLVQNIEVLMRYIRGLKPQTSKGQYVRGMSISSTMSPSVAIVV